MSLLRVAVGFVIEGAVAAGDRFELVVEVGDDLVHGQAIGEEEAGDAHGLGPEAALRACPCRGP